MTRILLRGARVITMVRGRPDWEASDILVENNQILAVGPTPSISDATIVDLDGRIIIPGLVNAHLHTWQTALRGIGSDWTLSEYLGHSHGTIARYYQPEDVRIAALAGALSQISGGTTTIGDWSHNLRTPQHADAAIEGLRQAGIRAVFLHGAPYTAPPRHPINEVDRLLNGVISSHDLLTLGMAVRGPQLSSGAIAVADFRAAHERNIIVSMHQSGGEPKPAWTAVRKARLFGPNTNIAHGAGLTADWIKYLVDQGVTFTATAENELGQGHGSPITAQLLSHGSAPSLGTDTDCVTGGDLLTSARIALAHQRGIDHDAHRRATGIFSFASTVTSKQALAWATVEGARALGISHKIGRIEAGLDADMVVINGRDLNLWPAHDPIAAALNASFGNIEAVMIGGSWRKWNRQLVDADTGRVHDELTHSAARIIKQFAHPGPLGAARKNIVTRVVQHRLIKEMSTPPDA